MDSFKLTDNLLKILQVALLLTHARFAENVCHSGWGNMFEVNRRIGKEAR